MPAIAVVVLHYYSSPSSMVGVWMNALEHAHLRMPPALISVVC